MYYVAKLGWEDDFHAWMGFREHLIQNRFEP